MADIQEGENPRVIEFEPLPEEAPIETPVEEPVPA